jgi:hypothetical protein
LLPVKNNIGPMAQGLAFHRVGCVTEEGIPSTHIVWDPKPVKMSANDALRAAEGGASGKAARREAEDFLKAELSDGAKLASEVREAAKANGISDRTIDRVKKELSVRAEKSGYQGARQWALPS